MYSGHKTATIFGGTGFIGSQIVRSLAKAGFYIKVAARVPERAYDLKPCGHVGQIVPIACDYTQGDIDAAIRGSQIVINCVGVKVQRGRNTFRRLHQDLPGMIAQSCARHGVDRFVHISSLGIDGNRSKYCLSKMAGEDAIRAAFPRATILRPSVVFGPEDGFFNMFAEVARFVPVLPLIGGGKTKLQPVYAGDVADAVLAAVTLPDGPHGPCGQTYELGGPEVLDFRQIYEMMFAQTGRKRVLLPLPWALAKIKGAFLQFLPNPLLTPDQVETLKTDAIVTAGRPALADLGVAATPLHLILPSYLDKYRSGGRFGKPNTAV
jgi:NADH dehydrogenase